MNQRNKTIVYKLDLQLSPEEVFLTWGGVLPGKAYRETIRTEYQNDLTWANEIAQWIKEAVPL